MPEKARNYSDSELDDISSRKSDPTNAMNAAKLRALEGGRSIEDREDLKPTIDEAGQAELDVLNVLKQVRETNPHLKKQNILEKRIQELEHAANPMERMRIQRDIGGILSNTYKQLIQDGDNEKYFRHHADKWTEQIKGLDIKEQVKWVEGIDAERDKRKAPFDALERTLDDVRGLSSQQKRTIVEQFHEQMAEQGRHDNMKYAAAVKANVGEFNRLMGQLPDLSNQEQQKRTNDFLNVSTAEQRSEIEKLKDLVDSKSLDNDFKQFSKERQAEVKDFFKLPKAEKQAEINKLYDKASQEYRNQYNKGRDFFTQKDFQLFEDLIKRKEVADLEAGIKGMPQYLKDSEAAHKAGEKKRKEYTEKYGKEVTKRIFDSVGWNDYNTTSLDRKKIIDNRRLDAVAKVEQLEVREKNIKKYGDSVEKFAGEGNKVAGHALMHKRGREANKKWFKSLDTKKQNQILAQAKGANKTGCEVGKTLKKREKINKAHAQLPKAVQKELHKVYENLGMEERDALNKKVEIQRRKNSEKYNLQLKKAAKEDLIPGNEKARKKLAKEFDELSLKEQTKRREKDKTIFNPQLQAAVRNFKASFATLPAAVIGKALQEFEKKAQGHERLAYIRIFLAKNHPSTNEVLNKELADIEQTELDRLQNTSFKDKLVDETNAEAEAALEKGDTKTALELYRKAAEMDPERDDIAGLAEILEESDLKNSPIPPSVLEQSEKEFDNLLQEPEVKDSMEIFKLLDEAISRVELSERQHQGMRKAEDRSMDALKNKGNEDAVELQEELDEYETEAGKNEKTVIKQEQGQTKATDVLKVKLSLTDNDLTSSDPEKIAQRRELIKDLRKKQGSQEGLDNVEFTDESGKIKEAKAAHQMREQMADQQKVVMMSALKARLMKQDMPESMATKASKQTVENKFEKAVSEYELEQMAA